ncbi:MAG: DNA-formamidopyrimidine glycosylase family protein [Balneolales bacterium]
MPELPDVESFKSYAGSTSLHQPIDSVTVNNSRVLKDLSGHDLERALTGKALVSCNRHGKNLFLELGGGPWIVMHFGMTGFLKYYKNPDESPPHERVVLHFDNDYNLAFDCQRMLGRVSLTPDPEEYARAADLGPDALEVDRDTFVQTLKGKRGKLKSALMNQESISGIGNVYSDEILYQMGLNPKSNAGDLDDPGLDELYRVTREVLTRAVNYQTDGKNIPDEFLLAHRKKGAPCPKGKGKIETMKVSGRTAYYCPSCQA